MEIRKAELKDKKQIEAIFDLYWFDSFRENLSHKLQLFLTQSPEIMTQNFYFLVAEDQDEILGVSAYRDVPEHMREFTNTEKPAEFYVVAVKVKNKGIGTLLRDRCICDLHKQKYTEIVFFSGETHQDSWMFHDDSKFHRVGHMIAPNGEKGYVWRLVL